MVMVTGIGIIGSLAGSLAGFLRLAPTPPAASPSRTKDAAATDLPEGMTTEEIAALRARLGALDADLERLERRL